MENIKMIVSDVDNTLMTDDNIIPPSFFHIINSLLNNNVKVVIASGRQLLNLYSLFNPFDKKITFISQNGSIISEGHSIIFQYKIPHNTVKKCIAFGIENKVSILLYTIDNVIVVNPIKEVLTKLDSYNVAYKIATDIMVNKNVYKISYFTIDNNITSIQNKIKIDGIDAVISHKYMIDITPLNINKGTALKFLQSLYNISPNMTCVFGDSENDIDMFKEAYYSYAMYNAPDNVKATASRIAPSNNQEGVITVLKQIFSISIQR